MPAQPLPDHMTANVFRPPGQIAFAEKSIPRAGYGEVIVKVRLTTVSSIDIHILRGEYAVAPGLTMGNEAVGIVHELGLGVTGWHIGERVVFCSSTPCGQCDQCLGGDLGQCGGSAGSWRLGHTVDGVQAEYVRVCHAQANLASVPGTLTDEDVLLLGETASTGFGAVERGGVRLGDTVAVFAQGSVGLCATLGARLRGASCIFAVDKESSRLSMALRLGATEVVRAGDNPVRTILERTEGRGVDVAIEALGAQDTFENALRVTRPGGTLSSLGIYTGPLQLPVDAIHHGLNDIRIVTTLCPGGKDRLRRLIRMVECRRFDLKPLITHHLPFENIGAAYELFRARREPVFKVAIHVA